jgi:curved DNA-binding protein CbpA
LKTHPDRLPKGHTPAEKKRATEKFQAVADAYYVLSDPARRRDYDNLARQRGGFGGGASSSRTGGFGSSAGSSSGAGAGGYQQQSQAPPGGFPDFDFAEFMNNMNNARKSSRKPQQAQEEEDDEEDEEEYEDEKKQGKSSGGFFNTFAGMFGMGGGKDTRADGRPDPNKMFGDVFEDM